MTNLLFDDSPEAHGHGKILGGGMVGTHAGYMIGEVALAVEMGGEAADIRACPMYRMARGAIIKAVSFIGDS